MQWLGWGMAVLVIGAIGGWLVRKDRVAQFVGTCGCLFGSGLCVYGALSCLLYRRYESRLENWNAPFASFNLGLDGLGALFLIPALVVGAMAGLSAMKQTPGEYAANRPREHWCFFNFLLASIVLLILSRNAVLFLFAWEAMTVASFLLVENDQRDPAPRGGWIYLTAGHLSVACIFAMFALLGADAGKLDFSALGADGVDATIVFILACAGFGGKAGLFPFHAWYAESYPQSPPHVGAVLSGSVGCMGLFGLLRTLDILAAGSPPPLWWGVALALAGLASALAGVLRALAARDLSRFLAWSSMENFGLSAVGIGFGLIGASTGDYLLGLLGFSSAIIFLINHSLSKGLLFLASRSVYRQSGTRNMDRMGGLIKTLPAAGALFLLGGMGAAALPPLNGFPGELLLLLSAYGSAVSSTSLSPVITVFLFVSIAIIALVGGIAAVALAKAFGCVFLGSPRQALANPAAGERRAQLVPQLALAAIALFMIPASPWILALIRPTAEKLLLTWQPQGASARMANAWLEHDPDASLAAAATGSVIILACVAVAYALKRLLARGKKRTEVPTWDCGYAEPDSRMQYTATSFARPLAESFDMLMPVEDKLELQPGLFPRKAAFSSSPPTLDKAWGYGRLFRLVADIAAKVRLMQAGRVQLYLLYMAVVLVLLLIWKL